MAGFGGLTDEVVRGQCAVEGKGVALDRIRERDWDRPAEGCSRTWRTVLVLFQWALKGVVLVYIT